YNDGNILTVNKADTSGDRTYEQYTQTPLRLQTEPDFNIARKLFAEKMPAHQIEFFRQLPLYHEDDFALYVHAGLEHGKHPRDTAPQALLWTRDMDFYKSY